MNFAQTDEQKAIREPAHKFADEEIALSAKERAGGAGLRVCAGGALTRMQEAGCG